MNIIYQHEINPLACGQAVLGMLCGENAQRVIENLSNAKETTLKEMREYLRKHNLKMGEKTAVTDKKQLPQVCVLSLETPRCWHWSLFAEGIFYDPEHGVLNDFPLSERKYYFEITEI